MNREAVFDATVDERLTQDRKWGSVKDHPHEVAGWIALMEVKLFQAKHAWAGSRDDCFALEQIRKVVALGMACLEQHLSDPDVPVSACPKCDSEHEDYDGFGLLACPTCKWCSHPSSSHHGEGPMTCNICGAVTGE